MLNLNTLKPHDRCMGFKFAIICGELFWISFLSVVKNIAFSKVVAEIQVCSNIAKMIGKHE